MCNGVQRRTCHRERGITAVATESAAHVGQWEDVLCIAVQLHLKTSDLASLTSQEASLCENSKSYNTSCPETCAWMPLTKCATEEIKSPLCH